MIFFHLILYFIIWILILVKISSYWTLFFFYLSLDFFLRTYLYFLSILRMYYLRSIKRIIDLVIYLFLLGGSIIWFENAFKIWICSVNPRPIKTFILVIITQSIEVRIYIFIWKLGVTWFWVQTIFSHLIKFIILMLIEWYIVCIVFI